MLNWDKLIQTESEKLLNYINKIVGEVDNSKDILQETFLACYKNIDSLDESYILPWLYRTAHNKAINFVKKHKRFIMGELPEQVHHDNVEEELKQKKREQIIQNCFRKLKPRYAMILDLQFYQKKSYKEIAEITGMTISAIESVLVRAKKECKKIMQEFIDEIVF